MKNAVIIGAGPAGITAAIYLVRAGIQTTVIYKDMGALGKTAAIDNYYGFPETISGPELFERGLAQARRLGVEIIQDEVVGISWEDKMTALTKTGRYPGDVIFFATGAARIAPKIEGLMSGGVLVAHNAAFDLGVLRRCLDDYDIAWKKSISAGVFITSASFPIFAANARKSSGSIWCFRCPPRLCSTARFRSPCRSSCVRLARTATNVPRFCIPTDPKII